jgi:FdrA protein
VSIKVIVKPHEYYDSVRLMQVSERVRREEGVRETILMMATNNNKRLLEIAGLLTEEAKGASANDLVIAIVAISEDIAEKVMQKAEHLLKEKAAPLTEFAYRTLDSALSALPDANLALISVPGEYAASETRRALERGLHVFLFSDNVPLEDEVSLKQFARERGLLVMGPDCGTAIINDVGLGFANVVRSGPIGIVGAAGTGIQEISVLIHRQGLGISHAIGTGGRDLSAAVGGIMMLEGVDLLERDRDTKAMVLISKPPDPEVAQIILQRVARCSKPVVVNFLGGDPKMVSAVGATPATTLKEAALEAIRLVTREPVTWPESSWGEAEMQCLASQESSGLSPQQKFVRGLFSGGTLCYEAMLILKDDLGDIYSNVPLQPELGLQDPWSSYQHSVIDLGDDEFTQGRAHPMIDPSVRAHRLLNEAQAPEVAVLLLDVVLGYGSHPDPAGSLAEAIKQAKAKAREDGRYLAVVASVCGTEGDPQDLFGQEQALTDVGVVVLPSNAQASRFAGWIAQLAKDRRKAR